MMPTLRCEHCGAQATPGLVTCDYCHQPVSAEAARTAIPCPQCRTLAAWGCTTCPRCKAWVVVQCLFCNAISPCNQGACMACHEPFAGAAERKAAHDAEIERQRRLQTVQAWGPTAGAFAGAVVGALVGPSNPHPDYRYGHGGGYRGDYGDRDPGFRPDDRVGGWNPSEGSRLEVPDANAQGGSSWFGSDKEEQSDQASRGAESFFGDPGGGESSKGSGESVSSIFESDDSSSDDDD